MMLKRTAFFLSKPASFSKPHTPLISAFDRALHKRTIFSFSSACGKMLLCKGNWEFSTFETLFKSIFFGRYFNVAFPKIASPSMHVSLSVYGWPVLSFSPSWASIHGGKSIQLLPAFLVLLSFATDSFDGHFASGSILFPANGWFWGKHNLDIIILSFLTDEIGVIGKLSWMAAATATWLDICLLPIPSLQCFVIGSEPFCISESPHRLQWSALDCLSIRHLGVDLVPQWEHSFVM